MALTMLAVLALTEWDRRQLLEHADTDIVSPLRTVLTPLAYLIVRGNRLYRRSDEDMTPM